MRTHTYSRSLESSRSGYIDSYNRIAESPQGAPEEYWTNGRTTIIFAPFPQMANYDDGDAPSVSSASSKPAILHAPPRVRDASTSSTMMIRNSIIAGSCAGIASTIVMYPTDVIRTKMQASSSVTTVSSSSTTTTSGAIASTSLQMKGVGGPWRVLKHTLHHGGIPALYTGMTMPLAAQALYKATVFSVNNVMQEWILDYKHFENQKIGAYLWTTNSAAASIAVVPEPISLSLNYVEKFLCGFIAGGVNAALFVTPVEFIRNQLIAEHTQRSLSVRLPVEGGNHRRHPSSVPRTTGEVIRKAWASPTGAITSLWRGVSWAVARDSIGCGCFFATMAGVQDLLTPTGEKISFGTNLIAGGVAGLSFWVVGLPFDTIKTWVQSTLDWKHPISPQQTLRTIYNESGPQAVTERLFRGWQVAYGRGIPAAAITMSVYTWVYDRLY